MRDARRPWDYHSGLGVPRGNPLPFFFIRVSSARGHVFSSRVSARQYPPAIVLACRMPGRVECLSDDDSQTLSSRPTCPRIALPKPGFTDWSNAPVACNAVLQLEVRKPARVQHHSDSDDDIPATHADTSVVQLPITPGGVGVRPLMFIEVFAGSEHLSNAFRAIGVMVHAIELKLDPDHDFSKKIGADTVNNLIQDARRRGFVVYIHFAPPCNTYSVARYPKLRTAQYPNGVKSNLMSKKDRTTLHYYNRVTNNTFGLMSELGNSGTHVSLEQPQGSLMLHTRKFKHWAAAHGAHKVTVDQCEYGMPYRKRTLLFTSPTDMLRGIEKECSKTHVHERSLSGWDWYIGGNCLATRIDSAAYPVELCRAWASAVRNAI